MTWDDILAKQEQDQRTYENAAQARRVVGVDGTGNLWSSTNPLPVNVTTITPDTPLRKYGDAIATYNVETTLISYTVPSDLALIISGLNVGGEADGKFIVYVDGSEVLTTYNSAAAPSVYQTINDNNLYVYQGQVVEIKVTNVSHRQNAATYQASLIGGLVADSATAPSTLNLGVEFYYKLDGVSGDVVDSAGTYNGTNNGATRGVTGHIGTAFSFDGSDDYIDTTYQFSNVAAPMTINFWMKTTTTSVEHIFSAFDGVGLGAEYIYVFTNRSPNSLQFERYDGTTPSGVGFVNANLYDGNWHMVTIIQTGGAHTDITMYLDGVSQTTIVEDAGTVASEPLDANMYLGARNNQGTATGFYSGDLDEFCVWSRAITSAEVTELFASGVGKTFPF